MKIVSLFPLHIGLNHVQNGYRKNLDLEISLFFNDSDYISEMKKTHKIRLFFKIKDI